MAKMAIEDARISFFPKRPPNIRETWTYPLLKKSWRVVNEREMAVAVVDVEDVG
jgi:hypothetical protein